MALVLREDKGSPLTHEEMDENWKLSAAVLGAWNATVAYVANDLTALNGKIYLSLTSNLNKNPATNPTDWQVYGSAVVDDVETISTASHDYDLDTQGHYHRHTFVGAKDATFASTIDYTSGMIYVVSNRAASGNLTLIGDGVTLNPPKAGTLVLEPGDTVTVKFVSATEADLYGTTDLAPE